MFNGFNYVDSLMRLHELKNFILFFIEVVNKQIRLNFILIN